MRFSGGKKWYRLIRNGTHIIIIFRFVKMSFKKILDMFQIFMGTIYSFYFLPFEISSSIIALTLLTLSVFSTITEQGSLSLAPKVSFKRKILEAYFIKTLNPILNSQLNSDILILFRSGVT